jgi:hypothetical protein
VVCREVNQASSSLDPRLEAGPPEGKEKPKTDKIFGYVDK